MGVNLKVNLGKLELYNPIIAASGTFGNGFELNNLVDIEKIGAITTKTITLEKRDGNSLPRILETPSGLLNSIGLQNPGVNVFINEVLPNWEKIKKTKLIVSIGGNTFEDYIEVIKALNHSKRIDAYEINVSCPNVKVGGIHLGSNIDLVCKLINEAKEKTDKPIIVKLSPNFSNLKEFALKIEDNGADIISLVNTYLGMAINIENKKPYFNNIVAGYSGPSIKPMALKVVHDICKTVHIPVIGMGGISNYKDSLEFMMVGASAVAIGTANFINPKITEDIVNDLENYCKDNDIKDINEIVGII